MKTRTCILLFVILNFSFFIPTSAQKKESVESLNFLSDSVAIERLNDSARHYAYVNTNKSIVLAKQALSSAVKFNYRLVEANALINLAKSYYIKGEYNESLKYGAKVGELSKRINYGYGKAFSVNNGGLILLSQDNLKLL